MRDGPAAATNQPSASQPLAVSNSPRFAMYAKQGATRQPALFWRAKMCLWRTQEAQPSVSG
jgi:hypothetical protein